MADDTTLTVLDLLRTADTLAANAVLYDRHGAGSIGDPKRPLRLMDHGVFAAVNW